MKDKKEINQSRRDLLAGLTTTVVASALVVGTKQVQASEIALDTDQPKKTKYRETQHIRDYYDSL